MTTKEFDPTKPVQTRAGLPATIIATDLDHPTHPIAARVELLPHGETIFAYTSCGSWEGLDGSSSVYDLVNVPEEREGWLNIYGRRVCGGMIHDTPDDAAKLGQPAIARIRIKYTEGEGL